MSDRRKFLKTVLFAGASTLVLPALQRKQIFLNALAADQLVALDPKDPTAQGLGYFENAAKVDVKKWTQRASAEGKKQFCDNCMLFKSTAGGRGSCQIFQGKSVNAKGWCSAWAKKA